MNQGKESVCYASRLSLHMSRLRPVPTRFVNKPVFVTADLRACSPVFLHHDAVHRPLQPVYDGFFQVVNRGDYQRRGRRHRLFNARTTSVLSRTAEIREVILIDPLALWPTRQRYEVNNVHPGRV